MKIKEIIDRDERDENEFSAIYECEHCGVEYLGYGYDSPDNNFYNNVIPKIKCQKCGKRFPA